MACFTSKKLYLTQFSHFSISFRYFFKYSILCHFIRVTDVEIFILTGYRFIIHDKTNDILFLLQIISCFEEEIHQPHYEDIIIPHISIN